MARSVQVKQICLSHIYFKPFENQTLKVESELKEERSGKFSAFFSFLLSFLFTKKSVVCVHASLHQNQSKPPLHINRPPRLLPSRAMKLSASFCSGGSSSSSSPSLAADRWRHDRYSLFVFTAATRGRKTEPNRAEPSQAGRDRLAGR